MNARVKLDKVAESRMAADFLASRLGIETSMRDEGMLKRPLAHTRERLFLVAVSHGRVAVSVRVCGFINSEALSAFCGVSNKWTWLVIST